MGGVRQINPDSSKLSFRGVEIEEEKTPDPPNPEVERPLVSVSFLSLETLFRKKEATEGSD